MDKRKELYKLYKERGLISDAVSEDAFLSASEEQQEKLYYLGEKNGLFKETELSTFQSAWSPSKKKEDSNLQSDQGSTSSATQEAKDPMPLAYFQDYASKANRAIDSGKKTEYERIKIEMDAFLKKNADYFSSEEDVKKEYNDTSKRAANIFKVDKQPSFMDLVPQAFTPIERGLGPLKEDAIPKVYGEDKRSDEEVVSDVISESIDMRGEQGALSLGISEALGREQSPLMQEEVSTEATTEFITPEQKTQARLLTPQQSMMGDVFEGTAIGDFSDDLYAAIKTGSAQKDVISPALALSLKGKEATDEEVLNFMKSYKALMNASPGRGFMDWQKTYEAGGGDLLAAIKATIAHPQGATEVFTTSLWAMLNKESLTAAGIAGGATTGAVATTGAPLPVAIGAGVKSAYAAGGAVLEGTLAFAEFLNEEIVEKGKKLTLETVRDVLEDEKAMTRLRARAGGRAATIAAVDLIGMHVGGKIAKKAVKKGKKGVAVATATGTEIVSGSSGEALARVVAGQKMDAGDILLEGIAGPVGVPATLADVIINPPSYKMNGQKVSGPEMARVIEETDDSDFAKLDLEIKNDNELNAAAKQRKTKLKVKKSLMDIANREITDEELDEFILLSEEKRKLSNKKGSKSKQRLAEVEEKIDNLYNKLESEDAVQEQSTDEVPIQPDAAVSEEVEEGVPEAEPEVTTEETEEKIADIERRRQEELTDIGRANLTQAAKNAKSDRDSDPNSAFKEMTDEEIDAEFQKALNSLNDLLRGLRKKGVSNERITKAVINKIINHPILRMRRGGSNGIIKSIEKGLDSFLPSQEVNAKYDSELAALEEATTPEVEQEVSDLEAALDNSEVRANQFQLAQEINDEELSKASGTTQVANTRNSYIKAAKKISDIEGDILDYGAGLGIGTDAMSETIGRDVESLEINPERWKGKKPVNYTNSNQIDKKFDGIVSLNVVNVVPKGVRDFIVKDIFSKLNVGGKAVISSRAFKDDIQRSKNFEVGPEEKSYIVKRKKDGEIIDVYQKGFDGDELVDYVKDLLGDSVEVKKDNTFGKSGVIITKVKEDTSIQPSLSVKSERVISEETQQRIADEMSEYKKARKIYDIKDTKGDKAKRYKIDVVQNKDLVNKVPRVSLDMLKGKKVNFVVLDKAMYNKNKGMTSGVFGALSDEYFGKIAHSVGLKAQAEAIADASAKSDYTVGVIMGNAGIDSNIYMYRDLVRQLKATGKESEYFKMFKDRVKGLNIPKASKKIVMESTSFDDLDTKYKQLGSETARKIIQGVMPSKSTKNPRIPIYNALAKEKIFLEDTRFSNEEKATMNIPSGSPFVVMELQDYSGKKITEKTKNQAIIDEEIRQEEGIQEDDNYSYMLRGTITGVFDETTPAYNIAPELAEEYVEGPRTGEKKITRRKKLETTDKLTKSQYIYRPFEASVGEGQRLAIRKLDKGLRMMYDLDTDIVDPYTSFMTNLSTAFPSINVVTDKNLFEERKSSLKEFSLMSKNQKIYGFVDGENGSIYLNPSLENYNTPIHEFGHVWLNVARHARPDLYKKGLELIEDSEYYNNVKNSKQYQKLSEKMTESQKEEYIKNEALATAIGDRGEAFVKQGKKQFAEFKSWMTQLFKYIKSLVGLSKYTAEQLQNITMDEFLDGVAVDLMSGEKVFAEEQSKNLISDLQLMTEKSVNENSLYEIIEKSRGLGFSDQAIKIVLQKKGFKVSEINKAMLIPFDVLSDIPLAFGNLPGGMLEGSKIYKDITNELLKKKNIEGKSTYEIRSLAQDLLKNNESFKKLNDTLQKELLISLDKSLMTTENKDVARDIRDMKRSLKDRRFAAREAQKLKTDLRNFIRANMPKASWSTSEVNTILREITDARINKEYYKLVEKPENDIRTVMYKVIDMINKKNSKMYMSQIEKLMSVKEEKKVAGRIQGRYTAEGVDRIKAFKEYMKLNDKSPIDEVESNIKDLRKIEETLSNKQSLTDSDLKKMEMVNVSILYNEALLMDNKEEAKAQSLYEVSNKIKAILSGERSEFRETQEQKHEYYKSLQKDAIEAISGQKVDLDSDESIKQFEENLSKKTNIKDNKPKIKKVLTSIGDSVDFIIKRMESLEGLLDRITTESTDIFGGKLSEIIDGRISESSRNYKQGKRELFDTVRQNAERIYGKKYKKIIKINGKKKYEIYTNKEEVDALKSKLEKSKDKKEKRKIADEIKSKTLRLTQNEMYYHYNQYKDLANHPGYESKKSWGDNTPNIMKQINETLDPRVIEWADWQVNEFFPSVYDRYNAVYRELYKTNMPWNAQYAGRLMRETKADDVADADLFNQMSTAYQNNIGSQSTKARTKNNRAILDANGDAVLMDYIDDMEYFRAYAETMRDISKIYNNNLVRDAIIATTSEDTYNVIFSQSVKKPGLIAKILNRDLSKSGSEGKLINTMSRNFVISRLGLNPTIFLKQFTSGLAFADYIGYRNWAAYASRNLAAGVGDAITFKNFNKTWKEMYKNSPELQDRYDTKDFSRVLETYTREASDELSGGINMGRVMDAMMYLVKQGDKGGVMGSIPNYLYYKDQYKSKNPKKTEQDAIEFAIRKVERQIKSTQQDQDIQNKDFYQTGEWYQRWLSMFQSSPRALLRKEIVAIRNLYRKLNAFYEAEGGLKEIKKRMEVAGKAGKGTTKQNIRTFIQYHVVVPMFFQYMAMGLPGIFRDWDEEEDLEDLGIAAVLGNLNAVFALGDIFSAIKDFIKGNPWAGDARGLPVFEMFVTVADSLSKYKSAKREETKNKYAMKALTSAIDLTGIPASQINKLTKNFRIILDKEYNTYDDYREAVARFFAYGDYQLKTKKQREEERRKRMKKVKIPRISY